ncbi:hypothetical protein [Beggiatoa leptomitoformis]|uniref:Uncharacterized protein n=1 Tax=Beggiatoa leptomitoformis TaxID=288004 RepID=A0A2N9YCS3_9GAMM|nr:hypothetical protein [Beggiatoa leptomitoformis]ALG66464.1 hypothetical protein AL038_00320 [Beggiatoa leptomitoformis]AUI68253.1 hypothetical protein BLE401_05750 [Beggiatoa leptomitoformis]
MNKRSILATAVALTLGSTSSVMAVNIDLGATSITPTYFASELPDSTTTVLNPGGGFYFSLPIPNYAVDTNNPFFIALKLKNGAKFNTALTSTSVECFAKSGAGTVTGYDLNLQVGGAVGTDAATFQLAVTAGNTRDMAATASGCLLTITDLLMTSGLKATDISAVVSYIDGFATVTKPYAGTFISYKNALQATYAAASDVVVDVTESSTKFIFGSLSKASAYLGSVKYAGITPTPAYAEDGTTLAAADVIDNNGILTITSPSFGAVNSGSGGVFLASTNTCMDSAYGATKHAVGNIVTFTGIAAASVEAGLHVCFKVDGATPINKGAVTASYSAGAQTGFGKSYRPFFGVASALAKIVKNGATVKVLNIPNPAVADDAFVRINNMSSQAGRILGTLYGQDGVVLGTAGIELATVTAYQTVVLDVDAIAAKFGVTTWTGRAWMQIDAEVSNVAVQGLIRTADGTLTNMSDGATAQK